MVPSGGRSLRPRAAFRSSEPSDPFGLDPAIREWPAATLDQIGHVLPSMPSDTELERRNRALIAFAVLTGARDSAIATLRLKHVDLVAGSVYQDA